MDRLAVGQCKDDIEVDSAVRWNHSGIRVMEGERYRVQASSNQWWDAGIPAKADGQTGKSVQKLFKGLIRCKAALWFQLVGALGVSDKLLFPLGLDACLDIPAGMDAELTLFANDVTWAYCNNKGSIRVAVTRLA